MPHRSRPRRWLRTEPRRGYGDVITVADDVRVASGARTDALDEQIATVDPPDLDDPGHVAGRRSAAGPLEQGLRIVTGRGARTDGEERDAREGADQGQSAEAAPERCVHLPSRVGTPTDARLLMTSLPTDERAGARR